MGGGKSPLWAIFMSVSGLDTASTEQSVVLSTSSMRLPSMSNIPDLLTMSFNITRIRNFYCFIRFDLGLIIEIVYCVEIGDEGGVGRIRTLIRKSARCCESIYIQKRQKSKPANTEKWLMSQLYAIVSSYLVRSAVRRAFHWICFRFHQRLSSSKSLNLKGLHSSFLLRFLSFDRGAYISLLLDTLGLP